MNRIRILYLILFTFIIYYVKCEQKKALKSKNLFPYFRRKVEELDDADFIKTTEIDDSHNLESFLVKNVKEIFDETVDTLEATTKGNITLNILPTTIFCNTSTTHRRQLTIVPVVPTPDFFTAEANMSSSSITTSTHTNNVMLNQNLPLTTLLDEKRSSTKNNAISTRKDYKHHAKDLKFYTKPDKKERVVGSAQASRGNSSKTNRKSRYPRRSCIMCNNVASEDCNDPKNKLITSKMCERGDDLCYSLHTPFGIIDRGCFNVNHNLTTYVCSCNLCNYISISEMPFMFSKKRDWVDNVVELSRTRHFRKSVFKDMSCLRCEVNTSTKTRDMLHSANCLEGNIGNLPMENCDIDEVCAVKARRADGYIWRGCIKAPLYNYWWAVCDRDHCNYDTIVTPYDFIT